MIVDDTSIQLLAPRKPEKFDTKYSGNNIVPTWTDFQVNASCTVSPGQGPAAVNPGLTASPRNAPWKLGFMQAQIMDTRWAFYRGIDPAAGCALEEFNAFQQHGVCRDYDRKLGTIWYEGSEAVNDCYGIPDTKLPPPWKLEFFWGDNPDSDFRSHVMNTYSARANIFEEGYMAIAFVTTLTELLGTGQFKHHRHFFWSIVWHATSNGPKLPFGTAPKFTPLPATGFWMSEIRRGPPVNAKYLAVLNNPGFTTPAVELAEKSGTLTCKPNWMRFPQMDAKPKLLTGH